MNSSSKYVLIACVFLLALATFVSASAQETTNPSAVLNHPQINNAIHFDISPPLRDMATEVPAPVGFHEASPVKIPRLQELMQAAQRGQKPADGALQSSAGPLISATVGLNLLGVGNGFPGYSVPDAPTDVNLAVGDTQVVQWVNISYAIFDKNTGAVIAGPVYGNAFWSGFGGACQNTNSGDPIMQWDKIAHRWLVAQNVFSSPYWTCIAISTTPDATGTYYRFQFSQPGFPDYPKWGVWPDAYYQAQNNFGSNGNSFQGAYVCAYERAKLLTGDSTAKQVCFQTPGDDGLLPADLDSPGTLPPAGEAEVFLGSIDYGTVYQYRFHADFSTPSNSTFTGGGRTMPVSGVASYSMGCGGFGACIPQKGVSDLLDSLGDRLMYRLAYRNFSDHQTWLVSHAVTAGSSVGERWYEFHAPENSTSLSVYQQGTFAPDSNYRWMGSIAMDQAQDIALGYSVSSSSLYPSIAYTGRVSTDTLGTMESEASIVSGTGSQTDTANRWGDYTSMALDAADDCTFWYTNQYYMLTATFDWSTRLASIKFPGCGGPPQPDFSITASPSSLTVAQGNQGTSTITVSVSNGFSNDLSLTASGMPSGVTVGFNPQTIPAPGSGTSAMTITVASGTTAGTYPITVTGSGGGIQHSTIVSLTVPSVADFAISASPSSLTIAQGNHGTSTITTTVSGGFNHSISLSASGLPSGTTVNFNPNTISAPGAGHSTLTINVGSNTPTGTYPITVTGNGGTIQHTTMIMLTVASPPNFTISASPSSLSILQGHQGMSTITTTGLSGFNSSIGLSISGLPGGASASFNPSTIPAPGNGTSTLTITAASNTPAGTYTLTVKGTGGTINKTTTISLTVAAYDFTISATPTSQSVRRGSRATYAVTLGSLNGFNGTVSLGVSGCPDRSTCSFSPASLVPPGNSTLTVSTTSQTHTGNNNITIKGTSGGPQHSTTVSLTVTQ